MLSTDGQIFNEASQVRARILEYGKLFEELHVIVRTLPGQKEESPIGNLFLWPTNNRFRLGYFSSAIKIGKKILKNVGDWVLTAQDPFETGLVAYQLKKAFKIPFQAQVHTDFLSPYFRRSSWKNLLRSLYGRWLIKRADRIRVVSERIKNSLIALDARLEKKIVVLPIFVDIDMFRQAKSDTRLSEIHKPGDAFLILTVARRESEKNLSLADEIVRKLKERHANIRWLLIGSGSEEGPANAATIPALASADALVPYYKMADLFLLTSNYEGYGMAAVEAAASGVPVVMTDVGVALGATFPVGNKEKAVVIIEELIQDPGKRQQLIKKQEEFLKNWPTRAQYFEQYKKGLTF